MIQAERHGDVVRFELSDRRSRLAGFRVSVYLVRGILIDCGFPAIAHEFTRLLDRERLRGVVVTHAHEDHAGNIEMVAQRGLPIAAHPGTLALVRAPAPIALYRRFTWGSATPLVSPLTPFDPEGLELIHTPGHAAGHLVAWDADTRTVFSADLFLGVKVRISHEYEEPRALVKSLRRIVALAPLRMFDAHRGAVERPMEAVQAKIDWMETTIGRMDEMIGAGASDAAISRRVLGAKDLKDIISQGEYSRLNLVRAVRRTRQA